MPRVQLPLLALGLIVPGGGSLAHGRWGEALLTAWTVAYCVATALVGLAVRNDSGFHAPLQVLPMLANLPWPPEVTPSTGLCAVLAVTVHVGCAWLAARRL